MLYTLLKFLAWGVLLAIIGGCIGWALRALKCRAEVARAKSATVDADEVDRMRHRLANLEQVVTERDRLRIQLADVRHADSPGIVGAHVPAELEPDAEPKPDREAAADEGETTDAAALLLIVPDADDDETEVGADEPAELDIDAAAAVLGKRIKLDDLTVVEGIGPKISELCSGIGVTTWRQLASTDIAELQSMLNAAGSRYAVHKPGTWSQQAELLATGKWTDFKTLTDQHHGGK